MRSQLTRLLRLRRESHFCQKWLLVLNFYPLADDISDVKSIIEELARSEHKLLRFDGIMWYDRLRQDLVEVPIGSVSLPK